MEVKYRLIYLDNVVRKEIPSLSCTAKRLIKKAIEDKIAFNPIAFGKPLRYSLKGHRSLRVGDYRVIYRIEQEFNTVVIVAISHRRDVYS